MFGLGLEFVFFSFLFFLFYCKTLKVLGVYRQGCQQQADAGDHVTRKVAARQARPPRVQRLRHGRARARGLRSAQRCRADSICQLRPIRAYACF